MSSQPAETITTDSPAEGPSDAGQNRPGGAVWFLLGAIVGAAAMAGAMTLIGAARGTTVDVNAVRQAAREGVAEALDGAKIGAAAGQPIGPVAPTGAAPGAQAAAIADSIVARPANALGRADAPVTVVEYSDFQCPYCLRHFSETSSRLIADYVNSGKVKVVFKNFPIPELHPQAMQASIAAECAADQGKFWAYHDILFSRLGARTVDYTPAGLGGYATSLQLDREKFDACLRDEKTLARVNADRQEGSRLGVRGTPTFFINGQPLVGAQPYEAFKDAIDRALAGRN